MRALLCALSVLSAVIALALPVRATAPVLPAAEWTSEARLRLAQALAGEAGLLSRYRWQRGQAVACKAEPCLQNRDWRIIPYVLLRRWEDLTKAGKTISFAGVVRAYCSPLKPQLATRAFEARVRRDPKKLQLVYRRRFIQALRWDESKLSGDAADSWIVIRQVVERFGAGALVDECPAARHWDWHGSTPDQWLVRVDCGSTLNVYSAPRKRVRNAQ